MAGRSNFIRVIYWILVGVFTVAFLGDAAATLATAKVYRDPSTGMQNTVQQDDIVFVARGSGVRRGDLIVFTRPGIQDAFIKRLIGLPGDHVACCDAGRITVNGKPLDETYVYPGSKAPAHFSVVLPASEMWVMGDNRNVALDSREWGPVPVSGIIGRVFAISNGTTFTMLRTPSTFVADGLTPADTREPLPLILTEIESGIFVVGLILAAVGLVAWIRHRRAERADQPPRNASGF